MIIPAMRIVPVLDLKRGIVVHARRGDRAGYGPLCSPLVEGSEPVAVARALCAHTGSDRLYVADLDAIAGAPPDLETLRRLAAVAELWVDAGATTAARAAALGSAGAARNVIGTESLSDAGYEGGGGPAPVLSVDLRDGVLISPRSQLAGSGPDAAIGLAVELGARELLVIDLARVGSRAGPPLEAVATLAAALPGVDVYAGGGVRDDRDLHALGRAGAAGALVATALHDGVITV
jgi:phosphoribosylformimino-5-aminoimidazole carboxamide ribotide isomerase